MTHNRQCEIEQLANQILYRYQIQSDPAQHLLTIAQNEHIDVMPYDDWPFDQCGRIMEIDGDTVIFYNATHEQRVINFTLAHELGHYFLKHLTNAQTEIVCLSRDLQKIEADKDPQEVEANFFAISLLLPKQMLLPVFNQFLERNGRCNGIIYVDRQACNFRDYKKCITTIQMYFTVSQVAIRYRLINLGKMKFNIQFPNNEDKGVNLEQYLKHAKGCQD